MFRSTVGLKSKPTSEAAKLPIDSHQFGPLVPVLSITCTCLVFSVFCPTRLDASTRNNAGPSQLVWLLTIAFGITSARNVGVTVVYE